MIAAKLIQLLEVAAGRWKQEVLQRPLSILTELTEYFSSNNDYYRVYGDNINPRIEVSGVTADKRRSLFKFLESFGFVAITNRGSQYSFVSHSLGTYIDISVEAKIYDLSIQYVGTL